MWFNERYIFHNGCFSLFTTNGTDVPNGCVLLSFAILVAHTQTITNAQPFGTFVVKINISCAKTFVGKNLKITES